MGKPSRNQNNRRSNSPTRNAGGVTAGQEQAKSPTTETQSPTPTTTSTMDQEVSRKRTKRFGHN